MTISTYSSVRSPSFLALALLLVAACGPAGGAPGEAPKRPSSAAAPRIDAPKPGATQDLSALYTADLTKAVTGARKVAFAGKGDFGGMTCSPGKISGTSAASRALVLTLPAAKAARAHVLAVVTPERGLLEIYAPYGGGEEAGDMVIPSQAISWAKAKDQARFVTSTDALDGLRAGRDTPEALFLEGGRYRFALVNGVDAELLKANGTTVKVTAACSFDWTP